MKNTRTLAVAVVAAVVALALVVVWVNRGSDDEPAAEPTVPAPNGGNITETVSTPPPPAVTDVPADQSAAADGGLQVKVARTRTATVEPGGPGESGGKALIVTLTAQNTSTAAVDLGATIVGVVYGKDTVAQPLTSAPYAPFSGSVEPGATARGVYVFRILGKRGTTVLTFQPSAGATVLRFTGL